MMRWNTKNCEIFSKDRYGTRHVDMHGTDQCEFSGQTRYRWLRHYCILVLNKYVRNERLRQIPGGW